MAMPHCTPPMPPPLYFRRPSSLLQTLAALLRPLSRRRPLSFPSLLSVPTPSSPPPLPKRELNVSSRRASPRSARRRNGSVAPSSPSPLKNRSESRQGHRCRARLPQPRALRPLPPMPRLGPPPAAQALHRPPNVSCTSGKSSLLPPLALVA